MIGFAAAAGNIAKFITDPKNIKFILLIIIMLLLGFMVLQRTKVNNLKDEVAAQKKENTRINNNWDASLDTLKLIKNENGTLTGEISGYQLNIEELETEYDSIFRLYTFEKNKPPKYIVEYVTIIEENINDVIISVNNIDSTINLYDTTDFGNGNIRIFNGKLNYLLTSHIKPDSNNRYTYTKSIIYSENIRNRGAKDAFVVAYKDDKKISIKESLKDTTDKVIYTVQVFTSKRKKNKDDLAELYQLDSDYIVERFEDSLYKYSVGSFLIKKNIETLVDSDELNTFAKLHVYPNLLTMKQQMTLNTTLYEDKETGKILINVTTDYPGITFKSIIGADILSAPESKKVTRSLRKEFGIGLHLGYGITFVNGNIKTSPVISAGINWTPKFLQW